MYYRANGLATNEFPKSGFYVEEFRVGRDLKPSYYFPGDNILYQIDANMQDYYDLFIERIIGIDTYYRLLPNVPLALTEIGHNSDFTASKESFSSFMTKPLYVDLPDYREIYDRPEYKEIDALKASYAYIADCHSLLMSLQNIIMGSRLDFVLFYKYLTQNTTSYIEDGVSWGSGEYAINTIKFAQAVFIDIASALDLMTKILYELEYLKKSPNQYCRLASKDILYKSNAIQGIDKAGTIFENDENIHTLIAIRNEIIHNGSWEPLQKVYCVVEDEEIKERYVLFPDLTKEGTLDSYINRKRFFSQGLKLNELLPNLYLSWLQRINATIEKGILITS